MKSVFYVFAVAVLFITSCKKSDNGTPVNPNTDNTPNWVGTYNGNSGQNIQRVIVERVDNVTLKMQLQTPFSSFFVTYATIQKGKIKTSTTLNIDEEGLIAGFSDVYRFDGSATLSGNKLTISGAATNKSNANDVKPYYFSGGK